MSTNTRSKRRKIKIEFYKNHSNEHTYRVRSSNGKIMSVPGEGFTRLKSCVGNVLSLSEALITGNFEINGLPKAQADALRETIINTAIL